MHFFGAVVCGIVPLPKLRLVIEFDVCQKYKFEKLVNVEINEVSGWIAVKFPISLVLERNNAFILNKLYHQSK